MKAKVSELTVVEGGPDLKDPQVGAAVRALWPGAEMKEPFPLVPQELSFTISDVPPSVANALQAIMMEVPGHALHVALEDVTPPGLGGSIDPFMIPEFLQMVIQNIPLRYGITPQEVEEVSLKLDVRNESNAVMTVSAGDLKTFRGKKPAELEAPLFNPTTIIAYLQPGHCIKIGGESGIRIVESTGRMFANAAAAIRGYQRALDLPELPKSRTHVGLQGDAQRCGFAVDVLTVEARKHRVGVTIPAVRRGSQATRRLPTRACNQILRSLRTTLTVIERGEELGAQASAAVQEDNNYWIVSETRETREGSGDVLISQGVLNLRGETRAFLELVRIEVINFVPDLSFIGVDEQKANNSIQLSVRHACPREDLGKFMAQSLGNLVSLFTDLGRQFGKL
jgi:hypothetical protein